MIVEYEGTWFHGFQAQGNLRTVQSVLEEALGKIFGHPARIVAAGRTDAGVHARGQVISTRCEGRIPTAHIVQAVNSILPSDVAVRSVEEVEHTFHARKSARSKVYRYYIAYGGARSPFLARYALDIDHDLITEWMVEAARHYCGRHDFTAFRAAGTGVKTSTRTVLDSRVWVEEGCFGRIVCFQVEANGFLYNMVRIMAGTLLEVGKGRIRPGQIPDIIESRDRNSAGPTLPARGLWLWEVRY